MKISALAQYSLEFTSKDLNLICKALAHLSGLTVEGQPIRVLEEEKIRAAELNRTLLTQREQVLMGELKSVKDSLSHCD
jgi:hypothetical protein